MNNDHLSKWVAAWKRAGHAMEGIRRQELRSASYGANLELIDSMLQWACDNAVPRSSTGLVEQQHLFQRLRTTN